MILVTGATGQLGQRIVQHLAARLPRAGAGQLAVSVRDPARAENLAARGIEVRQGNFDQPETLPVTFAGVDRLVLISTDGPKAVRIAQHRNAIEAARVAGVKHIFYTSFLDADSTSPSEFAQVHAATEADLATSGITCTLLRNGMYADFLPMTFAGALQTGVLHLPAGEGKVSYLSRNELAEAIAAAAVAPRLEKQVYELTGQTAHDYYDIVARVGAATGKTLRYEAVSEDAYAESLESAGLPAWLARALANMYSAAAQNRFARSTNDFAALVGHPPKSIDCLVAEFFRAP
ncbi:SDR family oxidoreductase [Aromatoleum diolicum]|uniref:NAD(P)H-binding protein n=1 Tax=Aromatoleum diolicum TaxID=75796 RepID=A0ABX1Q583_9RHOO|nr:SDR family oxidoreductase [Aromatoleum diolicum]NMG73521.1 NAD(P)H-binding protein [Aromatoleum diolicum]